MSFSGWFSCSVATSLNSLFHCLYCNTCRTPEPWFSWIYLLYFSLYFPIDYKFIPKMYVLCLIHCYIPEPKVPAAWMGRYID
jgi:hypothetical protein